MSKKLHARSLSVIFFNNTVVVSIFIGFMVAAIFIFFEVREFNKDAEIARELGLQEKKQMVKSEVEKVIDYIHFTRLFMEKRMEDNLKKRTYEAWSIINNIYETNKGKVSNKQIIEVIKNALRPIRFNNGRGYYFIVSLDGTELLYPLHPEFEGENLLGLKDAKNNYVIRDEIKIVKGQGEGFIEGYWSKPDSENDNVFEKTSFVKIFKPLNLYVGCGDYLVDVKHDIQQDVKERIRHTRFGKNGYVFVNTFDGVAVVIDSDKYKEGDTIWEMEDPYGVKVIQEEWKAVNKPGGSFINYHWKKLGSNTIAPKISFIKGVNEWQWMIGAGVYIDEIEGKIKEERNLLYQRMLRKGGLGLILIILVFIAIFYLNRKNSILITRNFEIFINKLRMAVKSGKLLEDKDYSLTDIQNILDPINEMISEKSKIEKIRHENELRFRTIFQNVPMMLLVFNKTGNNIYRNNEFNKVFNLHPGAKFNRISLMRFIPSTKSNKEFMNTLKEPDGKFREISVRNASGEKCHNWAAFKTEMGETILSGFDITELHQQKEKLRASNSTKDKVLSVISHDLHGPFNTIIGFSKILLSKDSKMLTEEKQNRYLRHIFSSSKGMHTMLTNLLNWARAQSGEIKLYMVVTDLSLIVNEVFKTLLPLAEEKNISLSSFLEDDMLIYTDASLMRIILQNLVANGIKFTESGGSVTVKANRLMNNKAQIVVTDSGVGMPADAVKSFNRGKSVQSQRGTNNESGTGLGLAICKDFVQNLKGTIIAESKESIGTSFTVTIPLPNGESFEI
jgi:signal transduction histidine kinase